MGKIISCPQISLFDLSSSHLAGEDSNKQCKAFPLDAMLLEHLFEKPDLNRMGGLIYS